MSYIQVASSLLPGKTNTPLDARSVVATVADISAIELPYVGMLVYCKADGKYYKITSLKAKTIGALSVPSAAVDAYEEFNPGGNAIDTLTLTVPAPPSDGDSLHVEIHRKNSGEWNVALDSETDYAKVLYFDGMDFASCTSAGIPGMFQGNACCVSVGSALHQGDLCRYKWKVAGDSTGTQDGDWQGFVWPAATVCNGGVAYIDGIASGGMSSGGDEPISSGGMSSGGDEPISSGGMSSITYEPLGSSGYAIYDSADNMLSSGAVLTNGNISSGYRLEVYSDGQAINPLLNGGTAVVFANGSAFSVEAKNSGRLVLSGGVADSASGCTLDIYSGGIANNASDCNIRIYSGGVADSAASCTLDIYNGGIANNASRGNIRIYSGGIANSTDLYYDGSLTVYDGGLASNVIRKSWGGISISHGGMVKNFAILTSDTTVFSCATLQNSMHFVSGAYSRPLTIFSGGIADGGLVSHQFMGLMVSSGGTANNITLTDGALAVSSGGTANNITARGGVLHVSAYGLASGAHIGPAGTMTVSANGVASAVTVSSGGTLTVNSGGMAFDVTSMTGAEIISSAGAYITYA